MSLSLYTNPTRRALSHRPGTELAHDLPIVSCHTSSAILDACATCSRNETALSPSMSIVRMTPSVASILAPSAASSTMVDTGRLTPPCAPISAILTSSASRSHSNRPLTMTTFSSLARRFGSGSVSNRRATYGRDASKKLKFGSSVKQMFSCVKSARITSENRSGTRIG